VLAEDGTLVRTGRWSELLLVIEERGDRVLTFVWQNKGALTVTDSAARRPAQAGREHRTARVNWERRGRRPVGGLSYAAFALDIPEEPLLFLPA
jgi:hypothetical protein